MLAPLTVTSSLAVFAAAVLFFHGSEWLLSWLYHRERTGWSSLLLSWRYAVAMSAGLAEFALEAWLSDGAMVGKWWWVGVAMIVVGEVVRKTAIVTAGPAFTHWVAQRPEDHHGSLVRTGIYGAMRHPAYVGFLLWALGTQVLLLNPVTFLAFAGLLWHFFRDRINAEDAWLARHFGPEYDAYRAETASGIPFIP